MKVRLAVVAWILGLAAGTVHAQNGQLQIHYINVGWGGSTLVIGPNGTTVLMEAGNRGMGTARVVPYLAALGIDPAGGLDYMIGGHQHCDHIGGLPDVINAGYDVKVKNYYNGSSYSSTSSCPLAWRTAAMGTTAGSPVSMPLDTVIDLGSGATLRCVAVNGDIHGGGHVAVTDENDKSIALLIQHGQFDFLWASDLGGGPDEPDCAGRSTSQVDVESYVVTAIMDGNTPLVNPGGIDLLHCNHHGSESSTNKNWMNYATPTVAMISTGAGQASNYQFPRKKVVEGILQAGAACVEVPATLVLQSEEGYPTGPNTSVAGYCIGNLKISTDGLTTFYVDADGQVSEGPDERVAAGLPTSFALH